MTARLNTGVVNDLAGNGNAASSVYTFQSDRTRPAVTASPSPTIPLNGETVGTFWNLSEELLGLTSSDFVTSNATVELVSLSGLSRFMRITPLADGPVSVSLPANRATDLAGNGNTASAAYTFTSDRTRPSVVVSSTEASPSSAASIPVAVRFSEDVTLVSQASFVVSGGLPSSFSGSGRDYSFDITPSGDGPITVRLPEGRGSDAASNTALGSNTLTINSDRTVPTIALSSTAPNPTNGSIPVSVTFSENVIGFDASDVSIGNGAIAGFSGADANYTFTVNPTSDGTVTVDIGANAAQDTAGNMSNSATQLTREYDATGPTVSITTTASDPFNGASFPVSVVFSEDVTGFVAGDVSVGNGELTGFSGSDANYSFTVTPDADGIVTVDIAADVAVDDANNGNEVATQLALESDQTDPTVTISSTPAFPGVGYTVTVTFDEAVTGLTVGEFTTSNVNLTDFSGSGTTYTMTATATDFAHSIQLPANQAVDPAGNGNEASNLFANTPDGGSPSITITGVPGSFDVGDVFNVTFTVSEPVVGFDESDVVVTGGTMTGFAGEPSVYTATITPDGNDNVVVSIAADAATDVSGQTTTGVEAVAGLNSAVVASETIATFLDMRSRSLLAAQPGLTNFLRGDRQISASVNVTQGSGAFSLTSGGDLPVWFGANGSRIEGSDGSETTALFAVAGAHLSDVSAYGSK